jgi:hypothetical protein
MAIIRTGAALTSAELQPGMTVNFDGFGLVTSTTRYRADYAYASTGVGARGTAHPDAPFNYLKAAKFVVSFDTLELKTITVDYVGIDPTVNSGVRTNPNTSSANGLTSENITTHPNFFVADALYSSVIAGAGPYTQDSPNNLAPNVNGKPAYLGSNGSCFEKPSGGRFIGFVDPANPSLYGKTQYLATTTTYSGVLYTTSSSDVAALLLLLNSATSTRSWGVFQLLPSWAPIGTKAGVGHKNLLSQVNVEEYGSLYKVLYEIRYARDGWDSKVYTNISV